jgi:hypothetical protein
MTNHSNLNIYYQLQSLWSIIKITFRQMLKYIISILERNLICIKLYRICQNIRRELTVLGLRCSIIYRLDLRICPIIYDNLNRLWGLSCIPIHFILYMNTLIIIRLKVPIIVLLTILSSYKWTLSSLLVFCTIWQWLHDGYLSTILLSKLILEVVVTSCIFHLLWLWF